MSQPSTETPKLKKMNQRKPPVANKVATETPAVQKKPSTASQPASSEVSLPQKRKLPAPVQKKTEKAVGAQAPAAKR